MKKFISSIAVAVLCLGGVAFGVENSENQISERKFPQIEQERKQMRENLNNTRQNGDFSRKNAKRPDFGDQNRGERPNFGKNSIDRQNFGKNRPKFDKNRGERPRFGNNQNRPNFGNIQDKRYKFGDRKNFKKNFGEKRNFNKFRKARPNEKRPVFWDKRN